MPHRPAHGERTWAKLPLVLGHEIVGKVGGMGSGVDRLALGERVGVPWLGWSCGACRCCRSGRENLCDHAHFTGYDIDGGFAELTLADLRAGRFSGAAVLPPQQPFHPSARRAAPNALSAPRGLSPGTNGHERPGQWPGAACKAQSR